jgi:ubiquinone/menaquinone biosynthesis C-methylase UbiE
MEETKRYYDERSKSYDQLFSSLYFKVYDAVTWKYLEPYVPSNPQAVVLDAGGGTGRWAIRMAAQGCRVVLVDASEGMLKIAERKAEEQNLQKIAVKTGDITSLDYSDAFFDMILCEHALFLFREPDKVVKELVRVLKTGAPLIISAQNRYVQALSSIPEKPNAAEIGKAFNVLVGQEHECMAKDGKVAVQTLTPCEFEEVLKRNGLRVEKIIGKALTMPLRIKSEVYSKQHFSEALFNQLLKLEYEFCEKPDALALAGHLQAIAYKI